MNTRGRRPARGPGSVDALERGPVSSARPVAGRATSLVAGLVAGVLLACGTRTVPDTADPTLAAGVVERTAPDRALQVIFDWRVLDGEARFQGSGSARIEPPYRARLDLFGPQGEGYLSAALVGQGLRLPAGAEDGPLPPPALMWAVLGVVAPPDSAELAGTRVESDVTELHYRVGETRLVYELRGSALRLVDWEGPRRRMVVELSEETERGLPREATYRDWSGYTELMLKLERVDEVESFPPDIWTPGG